MNDKERLSKLIAQDAKAIIQLRVRPVRYCAVCHHELVRLPDELTKLWRRRKTCSKECRDILQVHTSKEVKRQKAIWAERICIKRAAEKRPCACGCGAILQRKPSEGFKTFMAKRFVDQDHRTAHNQGVIFHPSMATIKPEASDKLHPSMDAWLYPNLARGLG